MILHALWGCILMIQQLLVRLVYFVVRNEESEYIYNYSFIVWKFDLKDKLPFILDHFLFPFFFLFSSSCFLFSISTHYLRTLPPYHIWMFCMLNWFSSSNSLLYSVIWFHFYHLLSLSLSLSLPYFLPISQTYTHSLTLSFIPSHTHTLPVPRSLYSTFSLSLFITYIFITPSLHHSSVSPLSLFIIFITVSFHHSLSLFSSLSLFTTFPLSHSLSLSFAFSVYHSLFSSLSLSPSLSLFITYIFKIIEALEELVADKFPVVSAKLLPSSVEGLLLYPNAVINKRLLHIYCSRILSYPLHSN